MSEPLDAEELRALPAEERFDHTIRAIAASERLWSLRRGEDESGAGTLLYRDAEGQELWPLWPSAELARLAATGDWRNAEPEEIGLKSFLDSWVTGLSKDGYFVVVCPVPEDAGLLLTPEELGDELLAILNPKELE